MCVVEAILGLEYDLPRYFYIYVRMNDLSLDVASCNYFIDQRYTCAVDMYLNVKLKITRVIIRASSTLTHTVIAAIAVVSDSRSSSHRALLQLRACWRLTYLLIMINRMDALRQVGLVCTWAARGPLQPLLYSTDCPFGTGLGWVGWPLLRELAVPVCLWMWKLILFTFFF